MKNSPAVSQKINKELPYEPSNSALSVYTKELKKYVHTKTFTQICIAALFIIAKKWKQPRCPSNAKEQTKYSTIQWVIIRP